MPVTCLQTITNSLARRRPGPLSCPSGQVRGAAWRPRVKGGARGPGPGERRARFSARIQDAVRRARVHSLPPPAPQVPAAPPAALLTRRGPPQEAARQRASASRRARPLRGSGRRCPGRPPARKGGCRRGSRLRGAAAPPQAGNRSRPPQRPRAPATGKWRRTAARRRGRAAARAAGPAPHSALCAAAAAASPRARGPRCPPPGAAPRPPRARCSPWGPLRRRPPRGSPPRRPGIPTTRRDCPPPPPFSLAGYIRSAPAREGGGGESAGGGRTGGRCAASVGPPAPRAWARPAGRSAWTDGRAHRVRPRGWRAAGGGSGLRDRPRLRVGGWPRTWPPRARPALCTLRPPRRQVVPGCTGERRSLGGSVAPLPLRRNLGLSSPSGGCTSNLGVWCVEQDSDERACSLSFALPFAVGVGEAGRGPSPHPNSARDAQVAPRAVLCCKAKGTQRSADLLPRIKKVF